jgi:hypothetical protein
MTQLSKSGLTAHVLAAAALLGCATIAHATLGGDTASVDTDSARMMAKHAARQVQPNGVSYTVQETTLPTGTVVRQYVSAAGVVFGVAWSGPFKPDLRQLMGQYFDTMNARQSEHVSAGHPFISQQNADLVVESSGRPRNFFGHAYLPSAIPAGVSPKEIQ